MPPWWKHFGHPADRHWWDWLVVQNKYSLPDRFTSDHVIVDVGCHFGAFAYACHIRRATRLWAFDASAECLALARENLSDTQFHTRHLALAPKGVSEVHYQLPTNGDPALTILADKGPVSPAADIDAVIDLVLDEAGAGSIHLMKVDVEGAEFHCFEDAARLDRVRNLIVEAHIYDENNLSDLNALVDALRRAGMVAVVARPSRRPYLAHVLAATPPTAGEITRRPVETAVDLSWVTA